MKNKRNISGLNNKVSHKLSKAKDADVKKKKGYNLSSKNKSKYSSTVNRTASNKELKRKLPQNELLQNIAHTKSTKKITTVNEDKLKNKNYNKNSSDAKQSIGKLNNTLNNKNKDELQNDDDKNKNVKLTKLNGKSRLDKIGINKHKKNYYKKKERVNNKSATEINSVKQLEPINKDESSEIDEAPNDDESREEIQANKTEDNEEIKELSINTNPIMNSIDKKKYNRKRENTIIVKNLDIATTKKELLKFLNLQASDIVSIRFRNLPVEPKFNNNKIAALVNNSYVKNTPKHAYISLVDKALIKILLQKNALEFKNRHIFIDCVVDEKKVFYDSLCSIFIGQLKANHDEEFIYERFIKYGSIKNIRIIRDPITHHSKKIAYVLFDNKASGKLAIKASKRDNEDMESINVQAVLKKSEQKKLLDRKLEKKNELIANRRLKKKINTYKRILSKNMKKRIKKRIN